jgi:rSAM/selenodomain-associated transferase 2
MRVSIIIPTLDDGEQLKATLPPLQPYRSDGHEVILVDGGSEDDTREIAAGQVDLLLASNRGRAVQMNEGARRATGELLLFLHADTILPPEAMTTLLVDLPACVRRWGRFDVRLSGSHPMFRIIETMMNFRSRLSGIATGDQAIFVGKKLFDELGGYKEIPLMEDIAICRLLKRVSRPLCMKERVVTSSRRWEENGILRTILLMWRIRLAYAVGADPHDLAKYNYN